MGIRAMQLLIRDERVAAGDGRRPGGAA
jgi:hypothetical protein